MTTFLGRIDLGYGEHTFDQVVRSIVCVKHGVHMMDVWSHPEAGPLNSWDYYTIEGVVSVQGHVATLVVPLPHKFDIKSIGSWNDYIEPSFSSAYTQVSRITTAYGLWSDHQRNVMGAFTIGECSCDLYDLPDFGSYSYQGMPQYNNGGILYPSVAHVSNDDSGSAAASALLKVFPDLMYFETACPSCKRENIVWELIQHLNDYCGWTRERIADWIEQIAQENGFDIEFPTPENIPAEPGEEKIKQSLEDS